VSEPPVPVKRNAQVLDEAAGWFVEFAEDDVPVAAREAFSQWLKASPEHVRAYLQIAGTFDDVGHLKSHQSGDAEDLIHASLAEGNVVELETRRAVALPDGEAPGREGGGVGPVRVTPRRTRPLISRALLPTAAGLAALAIAFSVWRASFVGVYDTGVGEQRIVNLADGSTIELNAESRIRVRLAEQERFVELLAGQALFHVAKDPTRPFIVESDGATVRAVGTQFDVNREATDTVVTVLEGRVAIARVNGLSGRGVAEGNSTGTGRPTESTPLYASAGEQVILTAQAASKSAHPNVAAATAWRERTLVFSSSPLVVVVDEYNRYHEKRLRVADPALSDFRISGVFSAADAASLIAFLRAQPSIEVEDTDTEIVLKSK
jgi:transmembrane sensor